MDRIFISYKRVDKDKVFKIKDRIESALGEQCWIDFNGIESDAQFANVIIKAINECEVFLFMYSSAHSDIVEYKNDWTIREIHFAQHKKKRIVFVNIDASTLSDYFYMLFGTMQQVDATKQECLLKLIQDIKSWLGNVPQETSENSTPSGKEMTAAEMNSLGNKYYYGKGVTQNYAEAVKWFRKDAEQGNSYAQNMLGVMYKNCLGVARDYAKAVKWFRMSAEQGNSNSQNELGDMYKIGLGVTRDYAEAVKWFRMSAEQGDRKGQNNLGSMYFSGLGVTRDYAEAVKWYSKSAKQGDSNAMEALDVLRRSSTSHSTSGSETND